jgi:uncharacterized protein (TIGR02001 family)
MVLGAAALALAWMTATPASAQIEGLTANGTVTSNYVFRGITQSADNPAVQGGLDYAFGDSGFAVGAWASSINFRDDPNADSSILELDLYASYSGSIGMLGYTVGAIGYLYPSQSSAAPDYNFFEIDAGLSYDFGPAAVSAKIFYSPDNLDNSTWYYTGGLSVPLGDIFSASANVGHYSWEDSIDYTDWNVGLAATYDIFTLAVMYTDTDIPNDDGKVVVSLTFRTM